MIGTWKNVAELEECLTIKELELIVKTMREKEDRAARWLAAVNGISLDGETENHETPEEAVDRIKRKVEAMNGGKTEEEFEYGEMGLDIEVEDIVQDDGLESLGLDVEVE